MCSDALRFWASFYFQSLLNSWAMPCFLGFNNVLCVKDSYIYLYTLGSHNFKAVVSNAYLSTGQNKTRCSPVPIPILSLCTPAAISTQPSTGKAQLRCPLLDPNSSLWDIDFLEMPVTVTLVEVPQKILLTSYVMSDIIKHTNSFI